MASASEKNSALTSQNGAPLLAHLREVGATAEIARLSTRLKLGSNEQTTLVRQRIEAWQGKNRADVARDDAGRLAVRFNKTPIESLDGLRGLPIQVLQLTRGCLKVTNLEPLRGMPLQELACPESGIYDLSPLQGSPLQVLDLSKTKVVDLSGLEGLPLISLSLAATKVVSLEPIRGRALRKLDLASTTLTDLAPLHGMPLEEFSFNWGGSFPRDLSPLEGAPLRSVWLEGTSVTDLRFLAKAPVTLLVVGGGVQDLSPLRGKPLRSLKLLRVRTRDLSALEASPIESLTLASPLQMDLASLLKMPRLERVSFFRRAPDDKEQQVEVLRGHPTLKFIEAGTTEGYRPVADFWAERDAAKTK